MFSVDCPQHGTTVLLGISDITQIENTASGIRVHYECTCGHKGVWLTGKAAG